MRTAATGTVRVGFLNTDCYSFPGAICAVRREVWVSEFLLYQEELLLYMLLQCKAPILLKPETPNYPN